VGIGDNRFIEENARWHDQACHRSLYSHRLRAALQLAIADPHRAVTFLGFACSGAETTFGPFLAYRGNEWVPNPPDLPQISAVIEAQCGGGAAIDYDLPEAYHINGKIPELQGGLVLKKCDARARKIDLLLPSIGGNARLLPPRGQRRVVRPLGPAPPRWLVRPGARPGRGWHSARHPRRPPEVGQSRPAQSVAHLLVAIRSHDPHRLSADGARGRTEQLPGRTAGMSVLPDFYLSEAKAREGNVVAERLNAIMLESALQDFWTMADAHRVAFRGRGLCAGLGQAPSTPAGELRIPRKLDGVWEPYPPTAWRPCAPRQRLFRTPNGAFMTNFHLAQSLLGKVISAQGYAWLQLLSASVYSGALHPTAEGQAVIADAVVDKAREVLGKYESRRLHQRVDLGAVEPEAR
jgi:hypothetical protein